MRTHVLVLFSFKTSFCVNLIKMIHLLANIKLNTVSMVKGVGNQGLSFSC